MNSTYYNEVHYILLKTGILLHCQCASYQLKVKLTISQSFMHHQLTGL